MKKTRICPTMVLWFFAAATPAWCQVPQPQSIDKPVEDSSLPKVYVQAGLVASLLPESTPYPRISYTVHGVAFGGIVAGGARLSRAVALEVETILTRTETTRLVFHGSSSTSAFDGGVRDVLFGANLRLKPSRNRLEFQVGGGVAVSRYSWDLRLPGEEVTRKQGMFGAGIAAAWRIGSKTAVVPTATYRWVNRPDASSSVAHLGASRHSAHIGVVVRR